MCGSSHLPACAFLGPAGPVMGLLWQVTSPNSSIPKDSERRWTTTSLAATMDTPGVLAVAVFPMSTGWIRIRIVHPVIWTLTRATFLDILQPAPSRRSWRRLGVDGWVLHFWTILKSPMGICIYIYLYIIMYICMYMYYVIHHPTSNIYSSYSIISHTHTHWRSSK